MFIKGFWCEKFREWLWSFRMYKREISWFSDLRPYAAWNVWLWTVIKTKDIRRNIRYSYHPLRFTYRYRTTQQKRKFPGRHLLYVPFHIEDLKIEMNVLIKNNRSLRRSFLQTVFGKQFLEKEEEKVLDDSNYTFINQVKEFILKI